MALTEQQIEAIDNSVGRRIEVNDSSALVGSVGLSGIIEEVQVDRSGYRNILYRNDAGDLYPFGFSADYAHSGYREGADRIKISVQWVGRCEILL